MKRICVFLGSSLGDRPSYRDAAERLGRELARRQITVVYGGGRVGLMGALADACLAAGGEVIGVIPHALQQREVGHTGLTQLHVVDSMHERKGLMAELADAFIALPGGFGTFEELCEILTWSQLGLHRKPCAVLDVDGYYAPLIALFDHATKSQFVRPEHRALVTVGTDPVSLVETLLHTEVPLLDKWIDRRET